MDHEPFTLTSRSVEDLGPITSRILGMFPEERIFALYGRMGAGKTTLIQQFCKHLDVIDVVQSPTFSIVNEYRSTSCGRVFHFDFYRIKKTEEVYDIGYEEYFFSGKYCFLEWPEKISELLPPDYVYIRIEEEESGDNRKITINRI